MRLFLFVYEWKGQDGGDGVANATVTVEGRLTTKVIDQVTEAAVKHNNAKPGTVVIMNIIPLEDSINQGPQKEDDHE